MRISPGVVSVTKTLQSVVVTAMTICIVLDVSLMVMNSLDCLIIVMVHMNHIGLSLAFVDLLKYYIAILPRALFCMCVIYQS